ncbi:unnamed protein product [Rotaria magnacalcarata]|uniref:FAS1 domain-containing protein n=1 Tax=Rotaria magnacalcarata TaxID=392030 RepID=A0A816UB36_9BILA|nr:unnamed protein product [Rotaria magnacalcarata]
MRTIIAVVVLAFYLFKPLPVVNLVKTLNRPGPFTVFAPIDAAFNKLPPGTLDNLLKPENRLLFITVLTYHVIRGREYTSTRLLVTEPPFNLTTLEGNTTSITLSGNNLKINDAIIIIADVLATNGIIHVLDTVLLPPPRQQDADQQTIYLCIMVIS